MAVRPGRMSTISARRLISCWDVPGVVRPHLAPDLFGKAVKASGWARAASCFGRPGKLAVHRIECLIALRDNLFGVGLIEVGVRQGAHPPPGGVRGDRDQVGYVVGAAALPARHSCPIFGGDSLDRRVELFGRRRDV